MSIEITSQQEIDELKATGKLPSPTGVAFAIIQKSQQEDVTIQEIAHLIQSDPALSGRILKYANSTLLGARRPIISIPDALIMVGLPIIRQLALGFSLISDSQNEPCRGFDYPKFWSRSLAIAIANRALSLYAKTSADETFTMGLLCDVGQLALATIYPDSYGEVFLAAESHPNSELVRLERANYATDHKQLAVVLLKDWGFPAVFLEAVFYHDDPDSGVFEQGSRAYCLVHGLNLAASLADACLQNEEARRFLLPQLYMKGARLGIEAESLLSLSDQVVKEWQEWGSLLNIPTPQLLSFSNLANSAPPPPEIHEAATISTANPLRILAIDDDPIMRALLGKLLPSSGHTVQVAKNGKEGLRLALEFKPHLVITDWLMPEMDGLEFCKALRATEEGKEIYIILLTALEHEDSLVAAFEAGADDYIVKPFSKRVLMARLRAGERVIGLHGNLLKKEKELRVVIAELAVTIRQLHELALKDPVTQLPNRRYGLERLDQEWAATGRSQKPLCVMLLDLDHFKQVNDRYGHDVGDLVLKLVARVLKKSSRAEDFACRLGGEEFLIVCSDTDLKSAQQIGERLRKTIESTPLQAQGGPVRVTASIGVAERSSSMAGPDDLIRLSDKAMYAAKNSGRNKVIAQRGTDANHD